MERALVADVRMTTGFLASSFVLFTVISLSLLLLPLEASAAEISMQNAQILPASASVSSACTNLQVTSFTPYIYDGELNSFDVTVPDSTYVVVGGSLNKENIPLNFITRYATASGVRMHVDLPSTPLRNGASIMLTMLSGKGVGQPVCAAVATITLSGVKKTPVASADSSSSWQPNSGSVVSEVSERKNDTSRGDTPGAVLSLMERIQNALNKTCTVPGAASRLWTVLLALYLLVVAAAILAQPPFKVDMRSYIIVGAAVVIPALLLFAIWNIAPLCHPGKWAPLFALLIALFGLVAGFRCHPSFKKFIQIFSLPEA